MLTLSDEKISGQSPHFNIFQQIIFRYIMIRDQILQPEIFRVAMKSMKQRKKEWKVTCLCSKKYKKLKRTLCHVSVVPVEINSS